MFSRRTLVVFATTLLLVVVLAGAFVGYRYYLYQGPPPAPSGRDLAPDTQAVRSSLEGQLSGLPPSERTALERYLSANGLPPASASSVFVAPLDEPWGNDPGSTRQRLIDIALQQKVSPASCVWFTYSGYKTEVSLLLAYDTGEWRLLASRRIQPDGEVWRDSQDRVMPNMRVQQDAEDVD